MPVLLSKFGKPLLYVIVGLFLMYWMIYLFTPKPQMPAEYRTTIDSLTKANKVLMEQQKKLDDAIKTYQTEVENLDSTIRTIKEKTTIVKEFHHEIIEQVSHYNATQIEDFFKTRYNY